MDFTGGFRNHFSSTLHYNYFSGNGFNLGQDLYSSSTKSLEKDIVNQRFQNKLPSQCYENEGRKRTSSCPLPTSKKRFTDNYQPPPAVDDLPDYKFVDPKGIDMLPEETLHILVTGPPHCGKTRIVESLAKRRLQIALNKGPSLAFNESFAMFGTKVHANVWYMKNPKDCTMSLKDAFSDKNFSVIMVYDVTVPKTLIDAREHILAFKRVFGANVPIILVGNKTDMRTLILNELNMLDWGFLAYCDGERVKDEYKLADFIECSEETGCGMDDMLLKVSTVALGDCYKF